MLSISSLHNIPLSVHYYALPPLPDHTFLVPLTMIFATPASFLLVLLPSVDLDVSHWHLLHFHSIPDHHCIVLFIQLDHRLLSYSLYAHCPLRFYSQFCIGPISPLSLLNFLNSFSWLSICFPCNALGGSSSDVGWQLSAAFVLVCQVVILLFPSLLIRCVNRLFIICLSLASIIVQWF